MKTTAEKLSQALQAISQNNLSGCLLVTDPNNFNLGWKLYVSGTHLHYATSLQGQSERLACLWQQYPSHLSLPQFPAGETECQNLSKWWISQQLPQSALQHFLLQLSLEAIAQILTVDQPTFKFFRGETLSSPNLTYPWREVIEKAKSISEQWLALEIRVSSPWCRFYLDAKNIYPFYKTWQNLNSQSQAPSVFTSHNLSFWLPKLSQKACLYEIATHLKATPLAVARQFQPLLKAELVEILPFERQEPATPTIAKTVEIASTKQQQKSPEYETPMTAKREKPSNVSSRPIVVCIDDSKTVQQQVKMTLEASGYEVLSITDPASTLTLLVRHKPALILMDINMPDIDGYELCDMLKRSRKLRQIPIVMLTGREGAIDRLRAKVVGAQHYLTKPFDPNQLIEIVNRLVVVPTPLLQQPTPNLTFTLVNS